jgi:hypothetical protein
MIDVRRTQRSGQTAIVVVPGEACSASGLNGASFAYAVAMDVKTSYARRIVLRWNRSVRLLELSHTNLSGRDPCKIQLQSPVAACKIQAVGS